MLPIYWIMAFVLIGILFWRANKGNKARAAALQRIDATTQLTEENQNLRHALAQMSMEVYSVKSGRAVAGRR
ncbi:MAG TPA: hypothetical protein VIJ85_00955 [Rhizomicrobium sp.]